MLNYWMINKWFLQAILHSSYFNYNIKFGRSSSLQVGLVGDVVELMV